MTMPEAIKVIGDKVSHRMATFPIGVWSTPVAPIDALLDHILREFDMKCDQRNRAMIYAQLGIQNASMSRARNPKSAGAMDPFAIPHKWLLNMQDYSGIPISELRKVACLEIEIAPHSKARRA